MHYLKAKFKTQRALSLCPPLSTSVSIIVKKKVTIFKNRQVLINLSQFPPRKQYVFENKFDDMPVSYSLDFQYVFHSRGVTGFAGVSSLHLAQAPPVTRSELALRAMAREREKGKEREGGV